MVSSDSERRYLWPGVISGLGIVAFIANIPHLLTEESLLAFLLGVLFPMGLASGLVVAGYWLYRSDIDTALFPRITAWVIAGTGGMTLVTIVMVLYQFAEGGVITHLPYVVLNLLTTGGIAGTLIGIYDGQQRQQQRITEQERQRYQSLLNASPDAIFAAEIDSGEIVDANSTAEELLDRSYEEIIGMHQSELHPADNSEQYRELFATHVDVGDVVMTQLPDGSDICVETASGEAIPVEINAARFEYGSESRFLGIFRDISDRKAREQDLQQRTEQLEALNRVVRHDIRNDMTVIVGWADTLQEHINDEGEDALERVLQKSRHVIELTEIARDFVESLSDEETAELKPIDLRQILEAELAAVRDSYSNAVFRVSGEIPGVSVQANEMLSSVFRNLLENAVQHNNEETPEITVTCVEQEQTVRIRIADNGPGIPDKQKEEIFGKGEKGLESAGSGIGLYLVHTLVDQFGGTVWVEDNDPNGVVFIIELLKARE